VIQAAESFIKPGIDAKESADSVEATIERRDAMDYDPTRRSLFPDFYNKYRSWREEMLQKIGLQATLNYDLLGQRLADGEGNNGASSGELSLTVRWLLAGQKYNRPFYLSFRLRNRHAYTSISPAALGLSNGLFWKTVDGFTDAGFQVPSLYLRQELADGRLILRYGQYGIDNFFDNHGLRSAKRFFLNQMFSNNPSVAFPNYGAGFDVQWLDTSNWDLSFGGSNIQNTENTRMEKVSFSLDSSALFYALQGGYTFEAIGERDTRVQLMLWGNQQNSEVGIPSGKGASLTLEQEGTTATERYVARIAVSEGDAVTVDRLLMLGYGREIRKYDHYGIGLGMGRSSQESSRWQGVAEIYYRWQVTKELMVTPDLQLIIGRTADQDDNIQIVAGIRGGFTF
jgi:porin